MAHTHPVVDGDAHFVISSTTREITTTSNRLELMQGDHLSERITFEIPKIVEGHDMSLCDRIKIHYTNTDKKTKATKKDVYIVDDIVVENDTILFSWLISGNATKYYGSLVFIVVFECLDTDGNYTYRWSTEICNLLSVGETFNNSKSVANSNSDALEKIKNELFTGAATGAVKFTQQSLTDEEKTQARKNIDAASTEDVVQPDWSQNDSTAKDYVKNRTHWVEHGVLTEILPETTFAVTIEDGESYWWSDNFECLASWSVGDRVVVICNGIEYNLTVYNYGDGLYYVGNAHIFNENLEDTGEPFYMEIFDGLAGDICFNASGTYTISVKAYLTIYHTIDPEYIKDMYYTEVYSGRVTDYVDFRVSESISSADDRILPLALGQVWDVIAFISEGAATFKRTYENVSVQQSDDGVLYIGSNPSTDDSEYAFYANSYIWSGAKEIWVTGVSGTYTCKIVHEIPDMYIPRHLRNTIQSNAEYTDTLNSKIYNSKIPIVKATSYTNNTYYVTINDRKIEAGMMFVFIPNVSSRDKNTKIVINNKYTYYLYYRNAFNPMWSEHSSHNFYAVRSDRPLLLMITGLTGLEDCWVIGESTLPYTGAVFFEKCTSDKEEVTKSINMSSNTLFKGGAIFFIKFVNGNTADNIKLSFPYSGNSLDLREKAVYTMDGSLVTAKDISSASKIYAFLVHSDSTIVGGYRAFILLNPDEPQSISDSIILQSSTENSDKKFSIRVDDSGSISVTEVSA